MNRLQLKTPVNFDVMHFHNGGICKTHIDYRFSMPWEALKLLHDLGHEHVRPQSAIADILRVVGPYATLWIDTCKGVVAPKDVQPEGWTWGNGEPIPSEFFWCWYPDALTEQALISQEAVLIGEPTSILKALVPYQLERKHGKLTGINGIEMLRLPGLVRQKLDWVFEWS